MNAIVEKTMVHHTRGSLCIMGIVTRSGVYWFATTTIEIDIPKKRWDKAGVMVTYISVKNTDPENLCMWQQLFVQ